jgi:hypothetical protein
VFIYIGITARLKSMLENGELSHHMRLPWPGVDMTAEERAAAGAQPLRPTPESDCRNLHQSVGWWEGVHKQSMNGGDPEWAPDGCNIALSLNVDGFQPFKRGGVTISPMSLMVLNLPENMRHQSRYMMIAGIIEKKEPKNMNTYLRFLVDELLALDEVGITFRVPNKNTDAPPIMRTARVRLLYTAADYPAHTKINCQRAHSSLNGCHKCDVDVSAQQRARTNTRARGARCRCCDDD